MYYSRFKRRGSSSNPSTPGKSPSNSLGKDEKKKVTAASPKKGTPRSSKTPKRKEGKESDGASKKKDRKDSPDEGHKKKEGKDTSDGARKKKDGKDISNGAHKKKDGKDTSDGARKKKDGKDASDGARKKKEEKVLPEISSKKKESNDRKAHEEKEEKKEKKRKRDATVDTTEAKDDAPPITPAQIEAFERFARVVFTLGIEGLIKEYREGLKPYISNPYSREIFDKNMSKNRYKDVVCNDYTRVILNDGKSSDYIHANYIRGEPLVCTFICTQGPLASTTIDFWRMIWMEKVCHIIMLCSVREDGKKKCEQYWPDNTRESVKCADFVITAIKVNNSDAHVTRTTLEIKQGSEKHFVKHHRWKTWPDKTVPKSLLAVFRILHQVRNSKAPVVVHCSAGIGRTGSFVAIEMALQRLLTGTQLNLLDTCKRLRDQRMSSVQVEIQYIYVAEALCEYGRAMKYIVDAQLLKEFERFKDSFTTYVAGLEAGGAGVPDAAAPLPTVPATPFTPPMAATLPTVPLAQPMAPTVPTVPLAQPMAPTVPAAPSIPTMSRMGQITALGACQTQFFDFNP